MFTFLRRDFRGLVEANLWTTSRYLGGGLNGPIFGGAPPPIGTGATFAYLEPPLGRLKSIELERNGVDPR